MENRDRAHRVTIAIAGNPNAGKTSLFNALTGLRQKVANYPGVTVESKIGEWPLMAGAEPARVIDLPGASHNSPIEGAVVAQTHAAYDWLLAK